MRFDLLISLMLDNPAATLKALVVWPKFSASSYAMVQSLTRQDIVPRTVLDIGANVGQFAIAVAKLLPDSRVYSYEPVPDSFQLLERHCRKLDNVTCFNLGLGDVESELPITVNSHSHSSSFLPLSEEHKSAFPFAREERTIRVPVTTLDLATREIDLTPPVLLKLDVQGFEKKVLEGGTSIMHSIDFIILEASLRPMYKGEILFTGMIDLLDSFGFEFLRPIGWLSNPANGEILQLDCLFQRRNH